jgi:hypothetical protein
MVDPGVLAKFRPWAPTLTAVTNPIEAVASRYVNDFDFMLFYG